MDPGICDKGIADQKLVFLDISNSELIIHVLISGLHAYTDKMYLR